MGSDLMNARTMRRMALGCLLFPAAALVACTADTVSVPAPATTKPLSSSYSIKLYVEHGDTKTRVDIVPIGSGSVPPAGVVPQSAGAASIHPASTPNIWPGAGLSIVGAASNDATTLLMAAAAECGMIGSKTLPSDAVNDDRYADLRAMYDNHQTVMAQQ